MALKFSIKKDLFNYLTSQQGALESTGMLSYSDYDAWFEAINGIEKIDVILAMVNRLESLDPMLNGIKYMTTEAQVVEEYMVAHFNEGNWDVAGKAYKPTLQDLNIPYKTYDCGVAISEKMFLQDQEGVINRVLEAVIPAYKAKLRGIALRAVLILPTDESKYMPCFWRDTSGFSSADNKLTPHPNGLLEFDNSESHYMAVSAYDKDIVKDLEDKVTGKGYGQNGLVVVANEYTWRQYRNSYTTDELEAMEIIRVTPDFAPEVNKSTYVAMSNADFPDDIFFAYDPNVKFLAHKESGNEKTKGLVRMFSTLETVRTSHRADFKFFDTGMGVVVKGAGAVMYVGGETYVNPDLSAI